MHHGYKTALSLVSLLALITAGCSQHSARVAEPEAPPAAAPASQATPGPRESAGMAETAPATEQTAEANAPADAAQPAAEAAASTPAPATEQTAAGADSATTSPAPATAEAAAAPKPDAAAAGAERQKKELAAKLLAMPAQDISKTISLMPKHPRVTWLSRSGQYAYYVGGEFNAEYNPTKKVFTISADPSQADALSCEYNSNGELVTPKGRDKKAECNELVSKLSNYLSR